MPSPPPPSEGARSEKTTAILKAFHAFQGSATPEKLWEILPLIFGEEAKNSEPEVFEALSVLGSIGFDPSHRSPSAAILSRLGLSLSAFLKEDKVLHVPITIPLVIVVDPEIRAIKYHSADITAFARWLSGVFSGHGLDFSLNHALYSSTDLDAIVMECPEDTPPVHALIQGSISPSSASGFPDGKAFYEDDGYTIEGGMCEAYLVGVARFTRPSKYLLELLCEGSGLTFPEGTRPKSGIAPLMRSSSVPIQQLLISGVAPFMLGRWQGFTLLRVISFIAELKSFAVSEDLKVTQVLLLEPDRDPVSMSHIELEVLFEDAGQLRSERFHLSVGPILRFAYISELSYLLDNYFTAHGLPFTSSTR